jgi:hypothetical protein
MTQPSSPAPISLQLTVDEINTILEALGQQPYVKVYQLIQKLHTQAQGQLTDSTPSASTPE